MNLVIISACDPIDQYVISEIAKSFPILKLIRPVWSNTNEGPSGVVTKLRKLTPAKVIGRVRSMIYQPITHRNYEKITAELFGDEPFDLDVECHDIPRSEINRQSTADLIRSLGADVLLVSNAPILRERIFTAADSTVNLHYGIAPKYRGTHTVFWPLYHRDYENVGVTLHHIDKGTDTGNIVGQAFPRMTPEDTEATLSAQCGRAVAKLTTRFLKAAEAGAVEGVPQAGPANTYFFRDRKLLCDLRVWADRKMGRTPPRQDERIECHFEAPEFVS